MRLLLFVFVLAALSFGGASAETDGRSIFRHGAAAGGESAGLPCRNCHGDNAAGQEKEGINAPSISWSDLAGPQRGLLSYDEALLRKALAEGIAPDGRTLSSKMPRYQLDARSVADLVSYLNVIPEEEMRGVTSDSVNIGVLKQENSAAFDAFVRSFEGVAGSRAIYGRNLRLTVFGESQLRSVQDAELALKASPVLAWIGDMEEDPQAPLLQALTRLGVPRLFPRRALLGTEDSRDVRGAFVTLLDQSRILIDAAAAEGPGEVLVVATAEQEELLQSALLQCRLYAQINCKAHPANPRNAGEAAGQGMPRIILFSQDMAWNKVALDRFRSHRVFVLADQFATALAEVDVSAMTIHVLDPRPNRTAEKSNDSERLGRVAAELLVKAIEQAGRKLTRTALMASLSSVTSDNNGWPALNYARYGLVGTNEAALIVFEKGQQRLQSGLSPKLSQP